MHYVHDVSTGIIERPCSSHTSQYAVTDCLKTFCISRPTYTSVLNIYLGTTFWLCDGYMS